MYILRDNMIDELSKLECQECVIVEGSDRACLWKLCATLTAHAKLCSCCLLCHVNSTDNAIIESNHARKRLIKN